MNEIIETNKINQDQEFVIQKKSENTEEIKLRTFKKKESETSGDGSQEVSNA